MMRTLILSSLYPLPENIGTRMRTMNFVRFFRKHGDVDLAYLRAGHEEQGGRGPFRKEFLIGNRVSLTGNAEGFASLYIRGRLRRLMERRPWLVTEWSRDAVESLVSIVTEEKYDFILCRYMHDSYPFLRLPRFYRNRAIIDFDDVYSQSLFDAYVRRGSGIYQVLKRHAQKTMLLSYQKRCLGFGAVVFCSAEDRDEVAGGKRYRNCFVVPNTYPETMEYQDNEENSGYPNRDTLLFVGALDYGPNIAGLSWFIQTILPHVIERNGNVRLLVVGRRPTEEVVRLCAGHPGIELHSDVPDVGSYYSRCGAVVVPLLSGGGTRIKILEAAVAGRAVLSTPLGAHGLDCSDGRELFLFSDRRSFLDALDRLACREVYEACVGNMHTLVQARYTPAAFDRGMEDVIASIA
jgi:glycosyltransferase involved in cell wall biosynthesis